MRKIIVLPLIMALSFVSLFASGEKENSSNSKATEAKVVTMQIGFENSMYEPIGQALQKWQQLVAEQGDGSLKLELYPDSQLGSKNQLIDSMMLGEPVITIAEGSFFAEYGVPDFGILVAPFLFSSWDECWNLIDSDWYKQQSNKLEAKGLKILTSNWQYGDRHIMTTKPVKTVEDLKGLKIRVPNNQIQSIGLDVLGATSTGMSLGDVYQALQTKTIDGAENPLSTLYGRKLQEVAKYLILDGHVKMFISWICSADFFNNSLTTEQQNLLISTANQAGLYNNQLKEKSEQDYLDKMAKEGVEITKPSQEVMNAFIEKAQPFYEMGDKFGWSKGLYQTVKGAMK